MRLLGTIGVFLATIFALALVAALVSGGALRDPDADVLRWTVWSAILAASALAAWWRWTVLGRQTGPAPPRRSAAPPEAEAPPPPSSLDRLSRISERSRAAALGTPVHEAPPADMPPAAPQEETAAFEPPPVEMPEQTPEEEPADIEQPVAFEPPPIEPPPAAPQEEPAAFEPPPTEAPPLELTEEAPPTAADLSDPAPEPYPDEEPTAMPPDPMPAPSAAPEGEFALATKRADAKRFGLGLTPMDSSGAAADFEPGPRTAVVFRQIFPPPHDRGLSFFGGAPIAAPGFAWPRPAGGAPYSFLMQVDCAELPAHARMGMPESGILYVFMDLTWGQQDAFRVIHAAADGELGEIAPPEDLPPAFGEESKYVWRWPRGPEELPQLLPKWRFAPAAIDIPAEAWEGADEEDEDAPYLWPGGGTVDGLLRAAQGEDVESDPYTVKDFIAEDGTLIRPFGHFPHDATAIRIVSGLLLEKVERGQLSTRAPEYAELSDEDRAALLQRIGAEAQEWYARAASEPAFADVPQEDADEYWAWLAGFPWLARFVMSEAVTLSVEASLADSAEAAARVPAEAARKVHSRHALTVRTETGYHTNIPDRMLAPPIDVQGNQAERARSQVLLLEISSNEGLGHHFGEGVCQFWIAPDDLAAGRFDAVELTADSY